MRKNKIILYLFTAVFLVLAVLFLLFQAESEDTTLFSIYVSSSEETEKVDCWKNEEDEYFVFLPSYAELSKVQIDLNTESPISIDGVSLIDGMTCDVFQLDVPYDLTYTTWGKSYQHTITFVQSGDVATMYIDTQSGSMEYIHDKKGNEETGTIRLYTDEGSLDHKGDLESINGRGNYTWDNFDKKAYSLKLSNEADLMGMGQAQKWILLANAGDSSNLRNKIVYDFAADIGLDYSPDSQWVDLYLNGEYAGLYLLCERNEAHPQRVDITGNDSFLVSLEPENRIKAQNYTYLSTKKGQALRVHYPLETSSESLSELTDAWQSVENAIVAENGIDPVTGKHWFELIDLDSWAKKYLIEEIFGNHDAGFISQYFYFDSNDSIRKIFAGPVWDYDLSIGNDSSWQLANPKAFFANRLHVTDSDDAPWLFNLYQKDEFYNRVTELYQADFLPALENLFNDGLSNYVKQISRASQMNQIRWFDENADIFTQSEYISTYMTERIAFLNSVWIDDTKYYQVRAIQGFGGNYAYYAVLPGKYMTELPAFEDTETSTFLGWYYADTDDPFDITQPINEDIEIYTKWQNKSELMVSKVGKLIPLGVIGLIFIGVFLADIKRMKRNG